MFNTVRIAALTLTITSLPQGWCRFPARKSALRVTWTAMQCGHGLVPLGGFRWQLPADWNLSLHDSARPGKQGRRPPLSQIPPPAQFQPATAGGGKQRVPGPGSVYGGGCRSQAMSCWRRYHNQHCILRGGEHLQRLPCIFGYDQNGSIIDLPRVITTVADQPVLSCNSPTAPCIKSIRLTINLLGNGASGYDPKTGVRPVATLVGNGRINN